MRKQYRFKYNLLRERCDAIRQDNEQLVSRIWEVCLNDDYKTFYIAKIDETYFHMLCIRLICITLGTTTLQGRIEAS